MSRDPREVPLLLIIGLAIGILLLILYVGTEPQ